MDGKHVKILYTRTIIAFFLVDDWIGTEARRQGSCYLCYFQATHISFLMNFSYEFSLDSETGKVGITRGKLESGGVVAREAHRRLSTNVCHGIVFLSYRHVYEHLLVHYDGITRLDSAGVGRNGS